MTSTPREERISRLKWSEQNANLCYVSENPYPFDATKIDATPLCLAQTFGLEDEGASLTVVDSETGQEMPVVDGKYDLKPQKEYTVISSEPKNDRVPIYKLFGLVPGATEDEQSDRLQALSNNFYAKIWHSPEVPDDFRASFVNPTSSDEIQAYRQFNWFCEVFGGPTMFGNDPGQGERYYKPRTMAKHTASRMTLEHSVTWLKLMRKSLDEEFPDDETFKSALAVYWLHFYAMFPFTDDERRQFRTVILEGIKGGGAAAPAPEKKKNEHVVDPLDAETRQVEGVKMNKQNGNLKSTLASA
jgi:truncated hemoglobin YjbI